MKKGKRKLRPSVKYALFLLGFFFLFLIRKPLLSLVARFSPSPAFYFPSIEENRLLPLEGEYTAKNIYVYDLQKQEVVIAKNAEERVAPASLTKMFSSLVVIRSHKNLEENLAIDEESYQSLISKNLSVAGFLPQEEITYRDALYGTLLASGAETTLSLAKAVSGDQEHFVEKMNHFASSWKLKNTHFTNAIGFDEQEHYSSAEDIGKFLVYALKNPEFYTLFTTEKYTSQASDYHPEGVTLQSTVLRKTWIDEEEGIRIMGGKSGTTGEAGLCWATLAEKRGKEYIVIVMGVPFTNLADPGDRQMQETFQILRELP